MLSRTKGITVIEVIIAVAIMGLAILGISNIFSYCAKLYTNMAIRHQNLIQAQTAMTIIGEHISSYDKLEIVIGRDTGDLAKLTSVNKYTNAESTLTFVLGEKTLKYSSGLNEMAIFIQNIFLSFDRQKQILTVDITAAMKSDVPAIKVKKKFDTSGKVVTIR